LQWVIIPSALPADAAADKFYFLIQKFSIFFKDSACRLRPAKTYTDIRYGLLVEDCFLPDEYSQSRNGLYFILLSDVLILLAIYRSATVPISE